MDPLLTPLQMSAAIHIGASSISCLISNEEGEQIEYLEKSTSLAHDIFSKNEITKATIKNCVSVLNGYNAILNEFGISPLDPNLRIVATNILSLASNADIFINRLQVSCNITVEVLDDGEMTRLIYMKSLMHMQATSGDSMPNTLVVHAGPGNTRTLSFKEGKITSYNSYRLGVYRQTEAIRKSINDESDAHQILNQHIIRQLEPLIYDFKNETFDQIICIGYELQHIKPKIIRSKNAFCSVSRLQKIEKEISNKEPEEIVSQYNVDYQTAEGLSAALVINVHIAETLGIDNIIIPNKDFERGLLQDIHHSHESSGAYVEEVISSVWALAKKYKVNKKHANRVTDISLELYDQLQELHDLDPQARLLLQCAALLHECGGFIADSSHHKHSQYIIQHSEIFGLSKSDTELIALIARYHRNSPPKPNHSIYRDLDTHQQMRVSKIASLLRIADALDRRHLSLNEPITLELTPEILHIHLTGYNDASVERISMQSKGNLFQNIFGLEIHLHETI